MFDALFLRQVWAGNDTMLLDLLRRHIAARPRAAALLPDQQGPWSRLDDDEPFVPGAPPKPPRRTSIRRRRRVRTSKPGSARCPVRSARGPRGSSRRYGAARRQVRGGAVHSRVSRGTRTGRVACCVRRRRSRVRPTLRAYLERRAGGTHQHDYYASDVAWMELDASIEPTIGPYDVSQDGVVQLQVGVRSVHHAPR